MRALWAFSFCVLLALAGTGLASTAFALEFQEARHLLLRAGFGPERRMVEALAPLNRQDAVELLLGEPAPALAFPACAQVPAVPQKLRSKWSRDERRAYRKVQRQCGGKLKEWYTARLLVGKSVLHEQMTLFWHNHFTSSLRKVRDPQLIANQHRMLYEGALGHFDELLLAAVRDPALLLYLDNVNNRKRKPNENLARELLELFTMGEGHYSEQDIRESARALTGLAVDPVSRATRFYRKRHDNGVKTIFGSAGRYDSRQLVDLILRQPATAEYITRELWLNFVSEPDEMQIRQLASEFKHDWDIAQLVRGILLSEAFWRDQGRMVKSPVELVIGSVRLFGSGTMLSKGLPGLLRRMGQDLFDPPNVKGWAVDEWIGPSRMLIRVVAGERLVRGFSDEASAPQLAYLCAERDMADFGAVPSVVATEPDSDCQQRIEALVTDPAWQLK
ncbi:hypothetical protein GCM10011348_14010 [Marinobacterium nitratireducens]|uniref:DUF1800 domain-containing protein n=1 Tax=Marinobacterium nitratireducens TaxID=518897 RepID=A0A918DRJ9_9GAMM|nr:hypothetical protein GCM10011348_14010 [Marinobacterium nitratireducens]